MHPNPNRDRKIYSGKPIITAAAAAAAAGLIVATYRAPMGVFVLHLEHCTHTAIHTALCVLCTVHHAWHTKYSTHGRLETLHNLFNNNKHTPLLVSLGQ